VAGGYYWAYAKGKEEKEITPRDLSTIGTCPAVKPLEGEEWRAIPGYEGKYEVSNLGRIRSLDRMCGNRMSRGMLLKQQEFHNGRLGVSLRTGKKRVEKMIQVHRAVAIAFVDGYAEGLEVNHIDENPKNNRWDNLEWCTSEYNRNYGIRAKRIIEAKGRPVLQLTLDGKLIAEYPSVTAAARAMGRSNGSKISLCCLRRNASSYGYLWRYKNDIDQSTDTDRQQIRLLTDKVNELLAGTSRSDILAVARQMSEDAFKSMIDDVQPNEEYRKSMHYAADIIAASLRTALHHQIDKRYTLDLS
jgi:hypothetical protein